MIRAEGNENIIIHHCPSGYPARLEGINLNIITTLRKMFPYPVAFSDHSPGWDMDVAAVTLGANLVEKTISEDRTTRGVEHIFSIEPRDMKKFVETVRGIEIALGIASPRHASAGDCQAPDQSPLDASRRRLRAPAASSAICKWNSAVPAPA